MVGDPTAPNAPANYLLSCHGTGSKYYGFTIQYMSYTVKLLSMKSLEDTKYSVSFVAQTS